MNERRRLEQAIEHLESQRANLGHAVVDASIAALREKLAALEIAPEEQRKRVTVLFADLAGWTHLAESMDPEEVQAIQQAYFRTVTPPIEQHGGNVEKYIGDAVLAVFGVPQAHENDPERAVRAALAMQRAWTERTAEGWQVEASNSLQPTAFQPPPSTLQLRVGVHTGLVVSRVDADGDFVVTGDTVNLASRLESAAEPGTVLISEETHKHIAHAFETRVMVPIQVKGKAEPVDVFLVTRAKATAPKLRGIAGLDSPLVGRATEVVAIQQALERLSRGTGGIITVVGEAGIGKSRLVAELRRFQFRISKLEIPFWLEGRCLSYGASIPYLLWLDVLRSALAVTLDDSPEQVRDRLRQWVHGLCPDRFGAVYPYLARLLSLPLETEILADLAELDGQTLQQRTCQALEIALTSASRQEPLILVCEDLHWADPSSLELLQHILPLVRQTPLLLIAVMRTRRSHGSWQLVQRISRDYAVHHVDLRLRRLSAADSEALVANLLKVDALPPALREPILERAEGNPFFVEEVIRSLIDMQAIAFDPASGRWHEVRDLAELPLPETLQGVLMARIDRLQADTRHVLQLASVVGRIFLYQVLAAIAEEERDLEGRLGSLQREELILERARVPELEYIFKHELTREATYNGILKRQRRVFHRRVAEALERLYPGRIDEMLSLLAYHWERAGDLTKASSCLIRAGDYARLAYGHLSAVELYQQAIDLLRRQGDDNRLARTLMKLAQAFHDAFDLSRSQEAYNEAFQLWGRLNRPTMPPTPHTYRFAVPEASTLDPALTVAPPDYAYMQFLFAGLVYLDLDGEAIPDMAQSWEIRDQGRTYLFRIRPDARWSDGVPVTARDFEYAWRRVLDPELNSQWAPHFQDVIRGAREHHQGKSNELGVWAEDENTLVVELVNPTAHFLRLTGIEGAFPVPRHVVEVYGPRWTDPQHFVCNGPFVVESYVPGKSFVWQRNPDYSGPFRGNVGRAEAILTPLEWIDIKRMYDRDEIDWLGIPWQHVAQVREEYARDLYSRPMASTGYLVFDTRQRPVHDRLVRQALAHAIDRPALPTTVKGCQEPAQGGFLSHGMPGYTPGIGLLYDPAHARELLAQAGYPRGRDFPRMTFMVHAHRQELAVHLVDQWRQVLDVIVEPCIVSDTWGRLYARIEEERPHISLGAWQADVLDPDDFLRTALLTARIPWQNPTYWRLVARALHLSDQHARLELYRRADQILVTEAPVVPLWYGRVHTLYKPWVKYTRDTIFAAGLRNDIIEPH